MRFSSELVSFLAAELESDAWHVAQMNNQLDDDDAWALGVGLQYNRSIRILHLVRGAVSNALSHLVHDKLVAGCELLWGLGRARAGEGAGFKRKFEGASSRELLNLHCGRRVHVAVSVPDWLTLVS